MLSDPLPPTCNGLCAADEPHRAPCPLATVTEIEWLRPEVDTTPRDAVGTPQVQHTTRGGRGKVAHLLGGKHGR